MTGDRWTIHETAGPGFIRPGQFNAVVSGRVLNTGERVDVVPASRVEALETAIRAHLAAEHGTLEADPAYLARALREH